MSPCSTTRSWPSAPSCPQLIRPSPPARSPASSRSPAPPSPSPSRPPQASSLPAKAARPPAARARPLNHAQALVGPHCAAPSPARFCSASARRGTSAGRTRSASPAATSQQTHSERQPWRKSRGAAECGCASPEAPGSSTPGSSKSSSREATPSTPPSGTQETRRRRGCCGGWSPARPSGCGCRRSPGASSSSSLPPHSGSKPPATGCSI
ncbi:hypothetical protein PAHAL_8G159500 [Panicum hallii]|uniref:Uncharacterized protein n=1 Tax=Panicum hallii TaxID=206008 RepID=A0A2T8I916_9POAL|nr:hypothetical protein PAHAL_8G159500 [Panicum hallii]